MGLWHFAEDGENIGAMPHDKAVAFAQSNPDCLAWREGMAEWTQVSKIHELCKIPKGRAAPPPTANISSDEIDYDIYGNDMQFVEIELDPDETAVAEAGALMYKDSDIEMTALLGDGSNSGVVSKLLGVGRRVITGESAFITAFTHRGHGKSRVAFAAPYPGKIIPITLPNVGGTLICQKDSFLCAARGVSIGIHFQRRILTGLFGGEGFIMQKLEGDGMVFVHAGGTIYERNLSSGEELDVDTGCLVAMTKDVDFDLVMAGGIKSQLFGGEGVFLAKLRGPGSVWLQSLPFSRLAGRMLASAPQLKGKPVGR